MRTLGKCAQISSSSDVWWPKGTAARALWGRLLSLCLQGRMSVRTWSRRPAFAAGADGDARPTGGPKPSQMLALAGRLSHCGTLQAVRQALGATTTNSTKPKNLENIFSPLALIKYHTGNPRNVCGILSRTTGISQMGPCAE